MAKASHSKPYSSELYRVGWSGAGERVFKLKAFARFQRKERLSDEALCEAIAHAERGLIDANLGGGLIKQRVPRAGPGRSGGYRTLVAYEANDRPVVLFGFSKSDLDRLEPHEAEAWRRVGKRYLGLDEEAIDVAIDDGDVKEVDREEA